MIRKLFATAAVAAAALAAQPAAAALFVSGDVNILLHGSAANQAFRANIVEGTKVLAQQTGYTSGAVVNDLTTLYANAGFTAAQLAEADAITDAALAGYDLFIGVLPTSDYNAAEAAALAGFLASGGNVLLAGDNSFFAAHNARINALLAQLGSGMSIINDAIDPNTFQSANLLAANAYTTGTAGVQYGATSRVGGGTALYGTQFTNTAFVAFEASVPAVPEPATWALMIVGFGAIGAAMRRAGVRTQVAFAG